MAAGPVATTTSGRVEGVTRRRVEVFRGIPYARAPRGSLRFREPHAPEAWGGVRDARRFGPAAPQSAPVLLLVRRLIGAAEGAQSQDCLSLNVWTPRSDRGRRPVLVWLHGGAFVMGTGATPLYAGGRMAHRGDAVIVTINYRLGALGFLNLRGVLADPPPCNLGIRDQVAALEWVRDNIENFGGDPENVTVFGESAGAMSVGTLLGIPTARGLFHRALLESGAASNVATAQQAGLAAEAFVDELGARDLALLEQAPVSALLAAQRAATLRLGFRTGALPWQPSVDGDFLPAAPLESVGKGDARDIPLLVGTNRDEWKLFSLADRAGRRMDDAGLLRRFERALPRDAAERALAAYRDALGARARPFDLWETFQSDRMFHYPAHRLAGLQSAHAPTYAYVFDWAPPGLGARIGACHGLEIPFVFGTLREPLLRPVFAWTPGARRLSDRMQRAWLEFARCGDPRHDDLPEWPTYDDNRRATMRLGTECVVRDDPFARARSFWGERERS